MTFIGVSIVTEDWLPTQLSFCDGVGIGSVLSQPSLMRGDCRQLSFCDRVGIGSMLNQPS
jgi:hypothetical protein